MSEISRKIAERKSEQQKQQERLTKHAQDEQQKLADATKQCISDVQKATKSAIASTERRRIYTPIISITTVFLLGAIVALLLMICLQNKTLAPEHPDHAGWIICQETAVTGPENQQICRI